jgi:hypothetical protein
MRGVPSGTEINVPDISIVDSILVLRKLKDAGKNCCISNTQISLTSCQMLFTHPIANQDTITQSFYEEKFSEILCRST